MRLIRKIIQGFFHLAGLNLQKALWSPDAEFKSLLKETGSKRLVSPERSFMLWQFCRQAGLKEGEMAEVGVYRGGTAKLIAKACPEKKLHLFDTFTGIPQSDPGIDKYKKNDFADTSLQSVVDFLKDCPNIVFHPGLFNEEAVALTGKKFCFVHIDADVYSTCADCLAFFYDRMVAGGVILLDDWDWPGCPGIRRAVSEFLIDKKETPFISASYQCAIIKS